MSTFLKGALILMAAGFITRILGFVNRIVIARMIGEEGVGLFMMTFPTLMLIITITQMGLPVAISKLVAEATAVGDHSKVKRILVVSLSITLTLSLIFTPLLIVFAPMLSEYLFTDPRTIYPLLAMTPIIPIIAISSVIRGYFQGKQQMRPAAISQLLEQVVRIGLIATFVGTMVPYGIEYAAAGAMVASVIGELCSLIYMFYAFKRKKKIRIRHQFLGQLVKGKGEMKELFSVSLPTTGSQMIGRLAWFFEPIVVTKSLLIAGVTAGVATSQYGVLTGYALPLLFLPSFITVSLSTSLVPAISEAYAKKHFKTMEHRLQEALRFCLVTGGLSVVLLYVFADPLMELMYGSTKGADFIKLLAPFFLFFYYQGPLQAVLQALDLAKAALINSTIGAGVKLIVIFALASRPEFGIYGAGLGIVVGIILVTLLHFATVLKKIPMTIYVRQYVWFTLICFIVGFTTIELYENFLNPIPVLPRLFIGMVFLTILYLTLLYAARLVKKEDLKRVPFVKKFF
ncbi:stage V sporulation protein B [Mangrovibacillus cuniculi]|uniref:Stage V sporulation protein B n=1 Tax=Mangrovibacillus cuniculi TaxID=2593652 RepID=A0A7S8CBN0_9BACI|nr:stage V sporulation protein B [Mangrovibacillus cuniculi]QPC47020.1 stage V sporulation protein B [Mangrovibacillus cuniculi]